LHFSQKRVKKSRKYFFAKKKKIAKSEKVTSLQNALKTDFLQNGLLPQTFLFFFNTFANFDLGVFYVILL